MIWLIIVLAFILRMINLNQSLWFDEAINVVYASSSDFWWFITKYPIGDFHPPGWFAILWIWGHIFNFSEIYVRLPSVILGVITILFVYLLGKEMFNKKAGLLAAFLLAIAPLHVYYSQEARMYALSAFASTLSFYFLNRLVLQRKWSGLGFALSIVIVLSSDYLVYLVIPAQILYLIWIKQLRRGILKSFLVAGIIFSPWLTVFPAQLAKGINTASILPTWANVVGSSFKDLVLIPVKMFFGRITFLDKSLYAIATGTVGSVFGSIFLYGLRLKNKSVKLLVCWIFIPLILAFGISYLIPVLSYFRMMFILPAFYLVMGNSLSVLPKKIVIPAVIFVCLVSFVSLFIYFSNPKFQREDWRGAVNFVSKRLDNQTLVVFESNEVPAPVEYYSPDISNFKPGLSNNLVTDIQGKNKIYLFEYLTGIYDPERVIKQRIIDLGFAESETYDFYGVGFVSLYTKF